MTQILKQSTAVDVLIGPFVDSTDGYTAEVGVSPSVKLSKNGQALAAKNDVTTPVHDADGYYNCELDATDTNTVGTLVLSVVGSATSLAVRHEYQVVEEAVYDVMYGASAAGPLQSTVAARTLDVTATGAAGIDWGNVENPTTAVDLSGTDIQLCDTVTTNTDMRGTDSAALASVCTEGRLAELDAANLPADVDAILADTNELQGDWVNGGRLDLILDARSSQTTADAIEADTQDIQSRLPAALVTGRMSSDAVAISGSTAGADNLEAAAEVIVTGAAQTGTLSITQMSTDLTEATDDHYIGRTIIWTSGALLAQATDITDYAGTNGVLTFTAVTEAPSNGDTFVIV